MTQSEVKNDSGSTRSCRGTKGSKRNRDLDILRQKALQLLTPNGDSRLFRYTQYKQRTLEQGFLTFSSMCPK